MLFDFLFSRVHKTKSSAAQQVRLHYYESAGRIYDHHNDPDRHNPLAYILHRDAETSTGPLFERMDKFFELGLATITGMGFDQFIQMPREYVLHAIEKGEKMQSDKLKAEEDQARKLAEAQARINGSLP